MTENARNLITRILVLEPAKRPTLEDILNDPFMGEPLPKTMPRSTLACPPAKNFIDQFTTKAVPQIAPPQISPKPSTANIEKMAKNSEKEVIAAVKPNSK